MFEAEDEEKFEKSFSEPIKPDKKTVYSDDGEDDQRSCIRITCPKCGERIYLVKHNGGTLYCDELGNGWPKHACYDYGRAAPKKHSAENRKLLSFRGHDNDQAKAVKIGDTVQFLILESDGRNIERTLVETITQSKKDQTLSKDSPIGRAILGRKAGETIEYVSGKTPRKVKIIEIMQPAKNSR
ncbi:MAG: GreA/GreB family elongation factor [Synergistaceae bacterium]|nr:GreA/GreB family elongation factor [Synergistaceae bacterium]